jgi:hypothetical protein
VADFEVEAAVVLDPASLERLAGLIADKLGDAGKEGGQDMGRQAANAFNRALRSGGRGGGSAARIFEGFEASIRRFENRLRGIANLATKISVDPGSFEGMNASVGQLHTLMSRFNTELEASEVSQSRLNALTRAGNVARSAAFSDLGELQSLLRNLNTQEQISSRERIANLRAQSEAERRAASERIVAAQGANSQLVAQTRAASQRRVEIMRAAFNQIRALERGLGSLFRGTANAIGATFRGIGSVASSAIGNLGRRTQALDRQFTQGVGGALGRREGLMRSSFSRQERILSSSVTRQTVQIQRLERALSTGVVGAATGRSAASGLFGGGLLAGAAGGIGLTSLLTQGFQRFSDIERLNKQFVALTGNVEVAADLMEQIKAFAKTTSFDLVGVADLAKGFLAIGTATEDVLPRVRTIADAVALTGGGVDELTRIQRAIGQVVSS